MYLDYWRLDRLPFENAPNRDIFYTSPQHEEALLRLMYAVEHRKGAALLTGEVGSGKTTISQVLMSRLPEDRFEIKTIVNPSLTPLELIRSIVSALKGNINSESKVLLLDQLQEHLINNVNQGLNTILIIDEAHMIKDPACLEELRMLLNMQHDNQFLVTLIILGQPPLLKNIDALNPLKERISIKYNLDSLDVNNTMRYILFRLKAAGADRGIFTKQSLKPIHEFSRGLPLRINNLCDRCMLIGMMRQAKVIDSNVVNDAIEEFK
jgi:general secretion pathway protein A